MAFKLLVVVLTIVQLARGIPSPNRIGSDLTLLINNDILGPESPLADSALILLTPRSQPSAVSACAELGELLWTPELNTSSIQANLEYLTFEGKYPADQLYWIAPSAAGGRVIDRTGRISNFASFGLLPALCKQSAPFSNITTSDASSKWQVTVHSNNEYITGYRDRLSFRFLGIRYAPEAERFTYSTAYTGTGDNVSALSYGSQCMQSGEGSEDCLFLNLWTPFLPALGGTSKADLKPVMFWIHGGGYTSGTANDPTFDGGNAASRGDVVMVACNYRLGALGFLALDDGITKGNYGLADAINALDWVRKNIQDFGGDPDRITIFGQSAGAATVRAMLASPKAKGKFQAAIPMSNLGGGGYGTTYSSWMTIDTEVAIAANPFLVSANCSTASSKVDCLRAIPADTFSELGLEARYLVIDGTYLTTDQLVVDETAQGSLSSVHLLQGFMRDDGAAITTYIETTNVTDAMNADGFNTSVVTTSGLFPVPPGSNETLNVFNVTAQVATDTIFRCFDQAAIHAAEFNDVFAPNSYFYEFNRSYQTPNWDPNAPVCTAPITASHPNGDPELEYFKCHSGDLYYAFGTIGYMGYPLRDENDLPFEQFILDSWTSFARTYNPNPDVGFLKARGYNNTLWELETAGQWAPLTKETTGPVMRQLQWPSKQVGFNEIEQCAALGWAIDSYI